MPYHRRGRKRAVLLLALALTALSGAETAEGAKALEDVSGFFLAEETGAAFLKIAEIPVAFGNDEVGGRLGGRVRSFTQGEIKGSRKQVAPLLVAFMEGIAEEGGTVGA